MSNTRVWIKKAIFWMALVSSSSFSYGNQQKEQKTVPFPNINRAPDVVSVTSEGAVIPLDQRLGAQWEKAGILVQAEQKNGGLDVTLISPEKKIQYLALEWAVVVPESAKYLGDAFERGYGDLEWRSLEPTRSMPWYFLVNQEEITHGFGVKTGARGFCYWSVRSGAIKLVMDVRNGGNGVQLGSRTLEVCTVVSREGKKGERPFSVARDFCKVMCPNPRLPKQPVYGFNDWYLSYGKNTAEEFLKHTAWIVSLSPKGSNRPFMVIDDGWQPSDAGPWDRVKPAFSKDMSMGQVASEIRKRGARPGLWCRPLIAHPDNPKHWRLSRDPRFLDPTVPDVRQHVREMMARIQGWGFELIKQDFSTWDVCGLWGFEMVNGFTKDGWGFADPSRTSAEVLLDFYNDVRVGAGDKTLIIGCNTIGHLSAGLFEIYRTGDDTSGKDWTRTRKMGVNTLAFRAPQHGTFFAADADCVGEVKTPDAIPWEKNQQWMDVVARSGTPLFISLCMEKATPEKEQQIRRALASASKELPLGEPLDWLQTVTPKTWMLNGERVKYEW